VRITLAAAVLFCAPWQSTPLGAEPRDQLRCDYRYGASKRAIAHCIEGNITRSSPLNGGALLFVGGSLGGLGFSLRKQNKKQIVLETTGLHNNEAMNKAFQSSCPLHRFVVLRSSPSHLLRQKFGRSLTVTSKLANYNLHII
jgi:hypothetical protein